MCKETVLAVTSFFPYPADRGDPLRVLMFLQELSSRYDLTVYAVERVTTSEDDANSLRDLLPRAHVVRCRLRNGSLNHGSVIRWMRALVRQTPSWILLRESRDIHKLLKRSHKGQFDRTFLIGEAAAIYARSAQKISKVHLDKANVLGASTAEEAKRAGFSFAGLRLRLVSVLSRVYERRTLGWSRTISVTSKQEAGRLQRMYQCPEPMVLPSAIDSRKCRSTVSLSRVRVLWLGSLQYRPNVEGLRKFVELGLPELREQGISLRVVGSGLDESLRVVLSRVQGLEVVGFVDKLEEEAELCFAAVVPLWDGAGVKLKTLTLMDLGLPVFSTTVGLEGMPAIAAAGTSDDPLELARAISRTTDDELALAAHRASRVVKDHFSREAFSLQLGDLLARL